MYKSEEAANKREKLLFTHFQLFRRLRSRMTLVPHDMIVELALKRVFRLNIAIAATHRTSGSRLRSNAPAEREERNGIVSKRFFEGPLSGSVGSKWSSNMV